MPQASPELKAAYDGDNEAWNFLKDRGFTEERFLIHIPTEKKLTKEEYDAIEYLITEWDWDAEQNGKSIWWGRWSV